MSEPRKYLATLRRNVATHDERHSKDVEIVAYDARDALFQAEKEYAVEYDARFPDQGVWVENVRPAAAQQENVPPPFKVEDIACATWEIGGTPAR